MRSRTHQKQKRRSIFLTNPILLDYYVRKKMYKKPQLNAKTPVNPINNANKTNKDGLKQFALLCALFLVTPSLIFPAEKTVSTHYGADMGMG